LRRGRASRPRRNAARHAAHALSRNRIQPTRIKIALRYLTAVLERGRISERGPPYPSKDNSTARHTKAGCAWRVFRLRHAKLKRPVACFARTVVGA
jgi:hypothetical protein